MGKFCKFVYKNRKKEWQQGGGGGIRNPLK
jgi:hypothetical protein